MLRVYLSDSLILRWHSPDAATLRQFLGEHRRTLRDALGAESADQAAEQLAAWNRTRPATSGNGSSRTAQSAGSEVAHPGWRLAVARIPGEPRAYALFNDLLGAALLIRDRMGCAPVHFRHTAGDRLDVAFDAETLASTRGVTLDRGRIADMLVPHLQWLDPTATFYTQIRKVPAGGWVRCDREGIRYGSYWQPRAEPTERLHGDDDYAAALSEVLGRAIMDTRPSSGEGWASMLSGGIDSTAMAALAASIASTHGNAPLTTVSIRNSGDPTCVETTAIDQAQQIHGIRSIDLDLARPADDLPWLLDRLYDGDEPWDASMSITRWAYRGAARAGASCLLDGIDADSLLGEGNPVPRLIAQLRQLQVRDAWTNARGLQAFWGAPYSASRLFGSALLRAVVPGRVIGRLGAWRLRPRNDTQRLAELVADSPIDPGFARAVDLLERQQRYEAEAEAQGALDMRSPVIGVERYFRVAAACGVVPLHPYLDTRVVSFCLGLPAEQKLRRGWPKHVLRNAVRGLVPEPVRLRRGKQHLGGTLTRTLIERSPIPLHQQLRDLTAELEPYVDPKWLTRLTAGPPADEGDFSWSHDLVALGRWLRKRQRLA